MLLDYNNRLLTLNQDVNKTQQERLKKETILELTKVQRDLPLSIKEQAQRYARWGFMGLCLGIALSFLWHKRRQIWGNLTNRQQAEATFAKLDSMKSHPQLR